MGTRDKKTLELPLELVVYEILTRLPVKTLTRFRCVSKSWNSYISNPRFRKEHLQHSQQTPLLLLIEEKEYYPTVVSFSTYSCDGGSLLKRFSKDFPETDEFGPGAMVNLILHHDFVRTMKCSCLGLVCLISLPYGYISVLNPSTEEIITLPPRLCQDDEMYLCLGFGYSAPTEEFKVVRFFADNNGEGCFCEVFTLGTGDGWRQARCPPPFQPGIYSCPPLLHGALHLLPPFSEEENGYIAAFDLETEEYSQVSLPKNYYKKKSKADDTVLAEASGSLCITFDFFRAKGMLQLWFLKDYPSGKWVKAHNINLDAKYIFDTPIAFTADGCILLTILQSIEFDTNFVKLDKDLCFYSFKEKSIVKKVGSDCSGLFFIESFFSLGSR